MPHAAWAQTNFNGGEWSPMTYGRINLDKYRTALQTCENYVPTVQGMLTRRPGTKYVAAVKDSTAKTRLQRFEFSTTQAYVLEFGNNYIRFFANDGQLNISAPSAYNGATAYSIGDLVSNGGVNYYCIAAVTGTAPPNATYWYALTGTIYEIPTTYATADLFNLSFTQSADTLYIVHPSYAPMKLQRFGATNWKLTALAFQDGPYLTTNATTTTISASATGPATGITLTASAALFAASDVGRQVRIKSGASWGWGTITAYTDSTHVTATITAAIGVAATTTWRLGLYGTANGYPGAVVFHEDRLVFGGNTQYPQRLDSSNSSDYENMAPTDTDGTVPASRSYSFSLNANTVNAIRWLASDERALLVGTAGGEWIVRASDNTSAISATNVVAKQATKYGSARVAPVQVGKATLFVVRSTKKVRELAYVFTVDGFQAPDLTLVGEHVPGGGLSQLAVSTVPYPIVWGVRTDGQLVGITYEREQEVQGWHRHVIGGYSNAGQSSAAIVESVASIPYTDGTRDEIWVIVNRYINGATKRYVEVMSKWWEDGDAQANGIFVDASLTYSGAAATSISGLSHLEGQTVTILADGAVHPTRTVSAGAITLAQAASTAQIGLGYNSTARTMSIEAGAADGVAQGKQARVWKVFVRLWQTVGMQFESVANGVTQYVDMTFRTSADAMGSPPALYSGFKTWSLEQSYMQGPTVAFRQKDPLPSNVSLLVARIDTQDGN
jgi:hypothetical protein